MTLREVLSRLARQSPSATLIRADESGSPQVWLSRLANDALLDEPIRIVTSGTVELLYRLEQGYPSYPALFLVLLEGEAREP